MMGWVALILLALIAGAALLLIGFPRRLWTIGATALTLGAAGYAWQGSPGLPDNSAQTVKAGIGIDEGTVAIREGMFGRFNFSWSYFGASDALIRQGEVGSAAKWMMVGTRNAPKDVAIWTGLGSALAEHDKAVSPAARYAFDRAIAIYPEHPGPHFFLGLALVRANQFAEARPHWAKAVELTPDKASYKPALALRLALLDRFLAEAAAQQQAAPPSPTSVRPE